MRRRRQVVIAAAICIKLNWNFPSLDLLRLRWISYVILTWYEWNVDINAKILLITFLEIENKTFLYCVTIRYCHVSSSGLKLLSSVRHPQCMSNVIVFLRFWDVFVFFFANLLNSHNNPSTSVPFITCLKVYLMSYLLDCNLDHSHYFVLPVYGFRLVKGIGVMTIVELMSSLT